MWFEELNKAIAEKPLLVWGIALLACAVFVFIIGHIFQSDIVVDFAIFIFWIVQPYICYVLAKSKNRSGILWALLGAWFFGFFPIIILKVLPKSKDEVY